MIVNQFTQYCLQKPWKRRNCPKILAVPYVNCHWNIAYSCIKTYKTIAFIVNVMHWVHIKHRDSKQVSCPTWTLITIRYWHLYDNYPTHIEYTWNALNLKNPKICVSESCLLLRSPKDRISRNMELFIA